MTLEKPDHHPAAMPTTTSIDWPTMLKTHQSWLKKVLRCRVADAHAVDDLLQDIAVAVYRQLENAKSSPSPHDIAAAKNTLPENPEKVGPWLYRVAIRQAVNYHRKRSRKYQPIITEQIAAQSSTPQPLQWMLDQEAGEAMKACIAKLDDAQREILMLKFTENWSYQQLADRLGISPRAVEHRLSKARKTLRQLLTETKNLPQP